MAGRKVGQGNLVACDAVNNELQVFFADFPSRQAQAEHAGRAAPLGIAAKSARKAFVLRYIDFFLIEFFCHFAEFLVIAAEFTHIILWHGKPPIVIMFLLVLQ